MSHHHHHTTHERLHHAHEVEHRREAAEHEQSRIRHESRAALANEKRVLEKVKHTFDEGVEDAHYGRDELTKRIKLNHELDTAADKTIKSKEESIEFYENHWTEPGDDAYANQMFNETVDAWKYEIQNAKMFKALRSQDNIAYMAWIIGAQAKRKASSLVRVKSAKLRFYKNFRDMGLSSAFRI